MFFLPGFREYSRVRAGVTVITHTVMYLYGLMVVYLRARAHVMFCSLVCEAALPYASIRPGGSVAEDRDGLGQQQKWPWTLT